MSELHDQEGAPASSAPANGKALLLRLLWPMVLLLMTIMLLSIGILALMMLISPAEEIPQLASILAQGNAIRSVVAMVLITPAIWSLAIEDKIPGAVAVTALTAMAGFMLGVTTK